MAYKDLREYLAALETRGKLRIKSHRMPLVAGVLGASLCYRRSKGGVVPGGRTSERPSTGGDYVERPPTDGAARAEPHLTPLVRATLRRRWIR